MSCKASLAALRLYGYLCDFYVVLLSKNKYDDDDSTPGAQRSEDTSGQTRTVDNPSLVMAVFL